MPAAIAAASVVVITRNQRSFLERSLPALAAQTGVDGAIEILVVDSGSTDGAREFVAAQPGVRLFDYPADGRRFNYARAYNRGIAAAAPNTPFVVRLSGDAVPDNPGWLAALLAPLLADETVACVWGRQNIPIHIRNLLERRFEATLRPPTDPTPRRYNRATTVLGSGMALRRDLWERHPFDERLPQAEDYEWLHYWTRRGMSGVYAPDAAIVHGHDEGWARALRRSVTQSILQGWILAR